MTKTALLKDNLLKYIDLRFFLRFVILFLFLCYFNLSWEALQNGPGLVYSSFIDHYLNYVHVVKLFILYISKAIAGLLGIHSVYLDEYILQVPNGAAVKMYYECVGFGLMSFWAAFVMAHDYGFKKRLKWTVAGILVIFLINCLRFVMLLYILNKDGSLTNGVDHHTMFNISCYVLIAAMVKLHGRV